MILAGLGTVGTHEGVGARLLNGDDVGNITGRTVLGAALGLLTGFDEGEWLGFFVGNLDGVFDSFDVEIEAATSN